MKSFSSKELEVVKASDDQIKRKTRSQAHKILVFNDAPLKSRKDKGFKDNISKALKSDTVK
jgi:hypothetical protein